MSRSGSQSPGDDLHDSWVELGGLTSVLARGRDSVVGPHVTASSLLQGEIEKILLDAQLECDRSSLTDGLPHLTPLTGASLPTASEGGSSPDGVTQTDPCCCGNHTEGQGGAHWIWDRSSRPENQPPKEFAFQHPTQSSSLNVRKNEVMKRGIFSSELLFLFIPTLLTSHLLTLGLGSI